MIKFESHRLREILTHMPQDIHVGMFKISLFLILKQNSQQGHPIFIFMIFSLCCPWASAPLQPLLSFLSHEGTHLRLQLTLSQSISCRLHCACLKPCTTPTWTLPSFYIFDNVSLASKATLSQSHISNWQGWDSNPSNWIPESMFKPLLSAPS